MTTTTDMQGQAAANVMEARVRADRPHRVQLSRKKGWRMPANTVSVARPGRWSNPFTVAEVGMPAAIDAFRVLMTGGWSPGCLSHLTDSDYNRAYAARTKWLDRNKWQFPEHGAIHELRGKNLACWCKLGDPCHADVLLDLANRDHAPIVQREVG